MSVQSLSVVVPNKQCINNCAFCVSKMHCKEEKNMMDDNLPFYDLYLKDYIKRLEYARSMGAKTVMLTGDSEPQQNRKFLLHFGLFMQLMKHPFEKIEMQTTGVLIDRPYLRFLRNHVGISTISLSLSALDEFINMTYNGTRADCAVKIKELCYYIKDYDFNLRLSLNLTDYYNNLKPDEILMQCSSLGANQVTFRVLYTSGSNTAQDQWIAKHGAKKEKLSEISQYIKENGRPLEILPYGQTKYDIMGMSVVLDDDCMSTQVKEDLKYLILRPDCKLYSKWDSKASLVF